MFPRPTAQLPCSQCRRTGHKKIGHQSGDFVPSQNHIAHSGTEHDRQPQSPDPILQRALDAVRHRRGHAVRVKPSQVALILIQQPVGDGGFGHVPRIKRRRPRPSRSCCSDRGSRCTGKSRSAPDWLGLSRPGRSSTTGTPPARSRSAVGRLNEAERVALNRVDLVREPRRPVRRSQASHEIARSIAVQTTSNRSRLW